MPRALEPGLTALWIDRTRECCKRGGHVIDVGAHFGYYSLLAASLGCHFTAFEPVSVSHTVGQGLADCGCGILPPPLLEARRVWMAGYARIS